ncbi:micrococcal nuclease [Thiolapillus brandeum]|uniref:Micrococcal nuclease n=2 Tax=Thiolapillus brandeum TaxID=1076588 RepID=A0A7U6JIR8_9GAMM|nr:micrococcal nuclease [Thiolapillus brandeum]
MKLTALLLFLFSAPSLYAQAYLDVIEIIDGDTLRVSVSGKPVQVQLKGIDAPEDTSNPKLEFDMERSGLDQASLLEMGQAATTHLKTLVKPGQQVSTPIDLEDRDRYGRFTAVVYAGSETSLNQAMVQDGYARPLKPQSMPKPLRQRLEAAWKAARDKQSGLFASHKQDFETWLKAQR